MKKAPVILAVIVVLVIAVIILCSVCDSKAANVCVYESLDQRIVITEKTRSANGRSSDPVVTGIAGLAVGIGIGLLFRRKK